MPASFHLSSLRHTTHADMPCACCADEKLTQEADTEGWDELCDVFAFRYLPESGRPEDGLQVLRGTGSFLPHMAPLSLPGVPTDAIFVSHIS